jgi:hypothetical protein
MEIFLNYVIPNVILFGGIYGLAKLVEAGVWYVICNYDSLVALMK